jgi:hypothetical protein
MSFEDLRALGLTPLEILTIGALLGLIAWIKKREATRDLLRQQWHDETRATVRVLETRVAATETKADSCERDRHELHRKVDSLRESVRRFQACPSHDCPMRK